MQGFQHHKYLDTSSWRVLLLTLATTVASICLMSEAAEPLEKNTAGDIQTSTVTYDPQNFAEYSPITVFDMLRRIPSASSILANLNNRGGGRGFGSGGQPILINGKRISGKSNGVAASLDRILASQVERIELIRGASSGLDVRSDGLIINIILREGSEKSRTSWSVKSENTQGVPMGIEGSLSHSGSRDSLEYNFTLERPLFQNFEKKDNNKYDPSGLLYENEYETKLDNAKFLKATTNLKYTLLNGDILHLNGLYSDGNIATNEDKVYSDIDLLEILTFQKTINQDIAFNRKNWEVGGDYLGDIDGLGQLKILFILNQNHGQSDKDRTQITESDTSLISREFNDSVKKEKILRAAVTRDFGPKHGIEYGIEGALNSLDMAFNFVDPQDDGGNVKESTLVSEKRFEGFGSHSYNPATDITLLSSLNGEYSNIIQEGLAGKSRSFFYLKPRIDLRYELSTNGQIRAVIERTVSQLNFEDFAIKFNADDNEFEKGNPNLEPEKAWKNSVTYEHRISEDGGAIEVAAFYNIINDHIDKIALTPDTQATGNINDATEYGMKVKSSFRLASLGLPNAILSADATLQGSNVTDPFTGKNRPIRWRGNRVWRVNFQHDISKANLSYGMELNNVGQGERTELDDHIVATHPVRLSAFMEVLTFGDIKLRVDARNILRNRRHLSRTLYAGNIADNTILLQKEQDRTLSRKIMISLRGVF